MDKPKSNKEILQEIVIEDSITNISFGENSFIIKFGDIKNIPVYDEDEYPEEQEKDIEYYLLDTYIEIPYTFEAINMKLHRGIINEFECKEAPYYWYSGFVHYSDGNSDRNTGRFCFGECGVDTTCSDIRLEGLTTDRFNILLIQLQNYLSYSSHPSIGRDGNHRRLDIGSTSELEYTLSDTRELDEIVYPSKVIQRESNKYVENIDYDKSYTEILKEFPNKAFTYNNQTVIPKVVRHEIIGNTRTIEKSLRIDINELISVIEEKHKNNVIHEVNNKRGITFQDLIHKFPDQLSRVDGCFYI